MNEVLKHSSELEMENDQLEKSNNVNAKKNYKFIEQVSKQDNELKLLK